MLCVLPLSPLGAVFDFGAALFDLMFLRSRELDVFNNHWELGLNPLT